MWLRHAIYRWLLPAAFLLPLWLLIGWGVFQAGGWAFLWVLFIAIPSVLIGQVVFTLLVRARPSARYSQAVSWWDVAGFGVWHALTIALGFYPPWFGLILAAAVAVAVAMVWLLLWQLWAEAKGPGSVHRADWIVINETSAEDRMPHEPGVVVIEEAPHRPGAAG